MKIMGLDCSSTSSGWCVFDGEQLIDYGCIKVKGEWNDRIIAQVPEFIKAIEKYKPDKFIMEDVPLKKNGGMKTLVILGAVHGMILTIASSFDIPIEFVSPSKWRADISLFDGTKEGKERDVLKKYSIEKANKLFGIELLWVSPSSKFNEDDIADAILVAYSQIKKKKRCLSKSKSQ